MNPPAQSPCDLEARAESQQGPGHLSDDLTTTVQTLKDAVVAFSEARDWARFHAPRELALALSVEAGELLELFLWTDDRVPGHRPLPQGEALADELADVTLCLLNLSARTGVDLASAVARKLEKNARKYPASRVRGSALRYHEYRPEAEPEAAPAAALERGETTQ